MAVDQVVKFFHGASTGIQAKIDDNTINENDLVITSDTDELVFIDSQKAQKPLGSSKSKNEYEVQLGSGGTASAEAIAKAKEEAIKASKAYTDASLTITKF